MTVRTADTVSTDNHRAARGILVDHMNPYNRTPVNKEVVYQEYNYTGKFMTLVAKNKWADFSIYESKHDITYVPVRVVGEYDNFIVIEVLAHPLSGHHVSESFTTTINKHDMYRGRVNLID